MPPSDRPEGGAPGPVHPDADHPLVSYFVVSFLADRDALRVAALTRCLPPGIEPQSSERLHLTYRSFDGLPQGLLDPLKHALAGVAARHAPILATVRGVGAFDTGTLWACVRSRAVHALQRDIDAALSALDLPPASHPFVPHVTLGNGPAGTPPPTCLDGLWMRVRLDAFALTTTGTAAYRIVRWFPLGEAASDGDPGED